MMTFSDPQRMQCMEVWGGNRAVQRCIETPGLRTWAYCKPHGHSESGGDVYYLSSCASGRITRMLLADVSGHGEVVSEMAVGLRDLMRRNVNYIRQTRFVRAMNQQFAELSKNGEFATALVSTYFAPTKSFSLCNAGHPPPLLFRQETSQWTEMNGPVVESDTIEDTPLGIVQEADYRQLDISLGPGDLVLSYSDAITESECSDGRQLGCEGVLELVRSLRADSPAEIIPAILAQISELGSENLRQDDVTILLCQATGKKTSLGNDMLAPFRFFGPTTDSTSISGPED